MAVVHSEAARAYSKYLEERPEVASYEACKPLDATRLNSIQKTDIRGEYFQGPVDQRLFHPICRRHHRRPGAGQRVRPDPAVRSRKAGAVPPLLGRAGGERLENRHSGQMRGRAGVLRLCPPHGACAGCARVKSIFSHTFYYRLFCKKCGETGISTLHTLHRLIVCLIRISFSEFGFLVPHGGLRPP